MIVSESSITAPRKECPDSAFSPNFGPLTRCVPSTAGQRVPTSVYKSSRQVSRTRCSTIGCISLPRRTQIGIAPSERVRLLGGPALEDDTSDVDVPIAQRFQTERERGGACELSLHATFFIQDEILQMRD